MEQDEIISICLSGATIILSIIAVFISIHTAKKQNKIALFEKRMEVYSVAKKLVLLGEQMRSNELVGKDYNVSYFFQTMQYVFSNGQEYSISEQDFAKLSFYISGVITSANFLFSKMIVDELNEFHCLLLAIEHDHKNPEIMKKVSKFSSLTIKFSETRLHEMEKVIKL